MPSPRRAATLLAVLLGLALPAGAGAQSPGDEQYQDPFGGPQPQEEPAADRILAVSYTHLRAHDDRAVRQLER